MADDTTPRNPNDTPQERTWTVPTTVRDELGAEVPAIENAQNAVLEAAVMLMRVGGIIQVAPKRVLLPPEGKYGERYETDSLFFRWQSFVPVAKKAAKPEPDTE